MSYAVEVTHAAWRALVPRDTVCVDVEHGECYRKTFFVAHGVRAFYMENFVSCVTQYYIMDINL